MDFGCSPPYENQGQTHCFCISSALPLNLRGGPTFINTQKNARVTSDMDFQMAERFQNIFSPYGLERVTRTQLGKVLAERFKNILGPDGLGRVTRTPLENALAERLQDLL